MSKFLVFTFLLFSFSVLADAKCDKISSRLDRMIQKGKENTWKYKKLLKKKELCDQNGGAFDQAKWKQTKSDASFSSDRKCTKLKRRLERACQNPDSKRCKKRQQKFETLGCGSLAQ